MGLHVSMCDAQNPEASRIVERIQSAAPDIQFELGTNKHDVPGEPLGLYSNLHRLRGFALHLEKDGAPPPPDVMRQNYPLLEKYYSGEVMTSAFEHLLDHNDGAGYYIPADMMKPINTEQVSIGSAIR